MNSSQGQEILRVHAKSALVKKIQKKTDQSLKNMDHHEAVNTVVNEMTEDYSSNTMITEYFNEQSQTLKERINKRKENVKSKSKTDMYTNLSFNEELVKSDKLNTGLITSKIKSIDFNNFDEPSLKYPNFSVIEDKFDSSPDESLTKFEIGRKMPKHIHVVQSIGNAINKYIEKFTEEYYKRIVDKVQEEMIETVLINGESNLKILDTKYTQIKEMELLAKKDSKKTQDEAIKIIIESLEAEREEELLESKEQNELNATEVAAKYKKLNIRDFAEFKKLEQRLESDVLLSVIDVFGGLKK